jgi:hypothetical protein
MREELFEELLASAREAAAIVRGEVEPSRVFVVDEKTGAVVESAEDAAGEMGPYQGSGL